MDLCTLPRQSPEVKSTDRNVEANPEKQRHSAVLVITWSYWRTENFGLQGLNLLCAFSSFNYIFFMQKKSINLMNGQIS